MQLPANFTLFAKNFFGIEYDAFIQSLNEETPTSIRINPFKTKPINSLDKIPWAENGYYLKERPSFTFDPLFHAGAYYVQEASSMFLEQVIKQYVNDKTIRLLDVCAAPGGKSTHLLSLLPEESLLVVNEVIRQRANILNENITKWGNSNVIVTNNDVSNFNRLKHFFDVILVDAPCSGEGMFRKDNESINHWSLKNVALCAERQQRILANVWESLKPGGILIYSTCTYNQTENEDNIQWLIDTFDAETIPVDIEPDWNIATPIHPHYYRFFPHKVKGEGFSLCVVRKKEGDVTQPKQKKTTPNKYKLTASVKDWIVNSNDYEAIQNNNQWSLIPKFAYSDYQLLSNHLKIISAGTTFAEIKGKDLAPIQSLALSNILNTDAFEKITIDWQTAIKYLQKEPIVLPENTPKGYVLLMYEETPLGFVKNIGTRANNLYPQEWRIRSKHVPEKEVVII